MKQIKNVSNPSNLLVYSRRKQDKVMDPLSLSLSRSPPQPLNLKAGNFDTLFLLKPLFFC